MKKQNQAFTLVELIVVITILAILWTIAFISLQWYSAQARDSKRLSDIQNIKKSLELFSLNTWKYPLPDDGEEVLYATELMWTQWIVWDTVTTNLSRNLNIKPIDPLTEIEYTYSTINSQTKYELLSIYESGLISYNDLLNSTNAGNANYPKINWNYNWVFVKTETYYIPTPSIINSELNWVWGTLDDNNITSQITTGWENNITNWTILSSTWWLTWLTVEAFSWTLDTDNWEDSNGDKELLAQVLIDAYDWTTLANNWIYKQIVETTWTEDLISLIDDVVLSSWTYVPSWWWDDTPLITDWRSIDTNCDLADVTIWNQTWAWCNSTLWVGVEYGNEIECYNYDKDWDWINEDFEWTLWWCWEWNYWDSNDNAKDYYDSLAWWWNQNWDEEVDNIWWKLYIWSEALKTDWTWPCRDGYYLPSDAEWEYAEEYLYDQLNPWTAPNNCRNTIWWLLCDWVGWKLYNTKNNTNNIVQALKLPLSGSRISDSSTFRNRGVNTYLWTSTSDGTYAYNRYFKWDDSAVGYSGVSNYLYGFSVRCIKHN